MISQRIRAKDEQGATLLIVLILVTVIAVVMGTILSLAETNAQSSVKLSDQAASVYGIDGAGQLGVNQLRTAFVGDDGINCKDGPTTKAWSNWVTASGSRPATSVAIRCIPDVKNGTAGNVHGANTSPGSAVLTLASVASGEDGIYVNSTAPGATNPVKVRGGIYSNSTIKVAAGQLQNTWPAPSTTLTGKSYVTARGACTGTIMYDPAYVTKTCNAPAESKGLDPGTLSQHGGSYDPPSASTGNATISTCGSGDKYQTVSPGRLTSAAALNALTGCTKNIVWFKPGVYYFDFQDSGAASNRVWTIDNNYVVAGTPSSSTVLTSNPSTSTWPDACVPPTPGGTTLGTGAEFVFGGDSQLELSKQASHGGDGGQLTICASNTSAATGGGPPIAIYGLKSPVGPVSAQSGCVTSVSSRCALIYSDQSPNTTLTIRGTTYTPWSWLHLNLNNSTNQVFRWGLITRSLTVETTGSPNLANAVIDVPDDALIAVPTPTISYLEVYACPGQSTCSPGAGTLQLRIKVQLSVSTPTTVTVLSWSQQN